MADNNTMMAVTDSTFGEVVEEADGVVVVDFWAPWCAPCRVVAPVLEELAETYADQVTFVKVDVDQNGAVAGRYNIRSIPTILIFKDGEPVDTIVGAAPKRIFTDTLAKHVE